MKIANLIVGLIGLVYLVPPHKPKDIGSAIVSLGFLISYVLYDAKWTQ